MRFFFSTLILFSHYLLVAQYAPGIIDTSFANPVLTLGDSTRFNDTVNALALQQDGKIIIGGAFTKYNNISSSGIIRLEKGGEYDGSFAIGTGITGGTVNAVAVDSIGKIYAGGTFTTMNGQQYSRIVRLSNDGSVDTSFQIGTGFDNTVLAIYIQPDNKALIAGSFTSYNGTTTNRIVRLNTDGTIDNSFAIGAGFNALVACIDMQNDGKILVGGSFTTYQGIQAPRLARLYPDGNFDISLQLGTGFGNTVFAVLSRANGNIFVGGAFTGFNGNTSPKYLVHLNNNGTLLNYQAWTAATGSRTRCLVEQRDGSVLAGGKFPISSCLLKFSFDSLDYPSTAGFQRDLDPLAVNALASEGDYIIAGGSFKEIKSAARNYIARLDQRGWADGTFTLSYEFGLNVYDINKQSDGKLLIAGRFGSYNGLRSKDIVRLDANGERDTTFTSRFIVLGSAPDVKCVIYDTALSKIYIAGRFYYYDNGAPQSLARLNLDGSLDETFIRNGGFPGFLNKITRQADGKIIVVGSFSTYSINNSEDITGLNRIARIHPNSAFDTTYHVGTGFNKPPLDIALQEDGKAIVSGPFETYNGVTVNGLVRLKTDGEIDTSFALFASNTDAGPLCIQPDGKILVSNTSLGSLLRLDTNGTVDTSFSTVAIPNINTIKLQHDGKILVGGDFANYYGYKHFVRLKTNGEVDSTLITGSGFNDQIFAIHELPNQQLVIGGDFTKYNNYFINRITKIFGDECNTPQLTSIEGPTEICQGTATSFTTAALNATEGYVWTYPSGWLANTSQDSLYAIIGDTAQSGLIQVNGKNSCGVGQPVSLSVSIKSKPAQPSFIAGPTQLCAQSGNTVYISEQTANTTNYIWTYPNGWLTNVSLDSLYAVVGDSTQSGAITVCAENDCGQSIAQILQVIVDSSVTPIANITVVDSAVCKGTGFSFEANVTGEGTSPSYVWTINGDTVSNFTTLFNIDSLENGDVVQFHLHSSLQCATNPVVVSNSIAVIVYGAPDVPSITILGDTIISSVLYGNQWYNTNGTPVDGEIGQTFMPNETGEYYTVATDSNGCVSLPSDTVAFIISGVKEVNPSLNISIYPNPTQGLVHIVSHTEVAYTVCLYNTHGVLLATKNAIGKSGSINLESFANGIYYIEVQDADNNVMRKRILKL